jgi:hypothetical protein
MTGSDYSFLFPNNDAEQRFWLHGIILKLPLVSIGYERCPHQVNLLEMEGIKSYYIVKGGVKNEKNLCLYKLTDGNQFFYAVPGVD